MSYLRNFTNNREKNNMSNPTYNQSRQVQPKVNLEPRSPVVNTSLFMMINQQHESEPMSQNSEIPLNLPKMIYNTPRSNVPQKRTHEELQPQWSMHNSLPPRILQTSGPRQLMPSPAPQANHSKLPTVSGPWQLISSPTPQAGHSVLPTASGSWQLISSPVSQAGQSMLPPAPHLPSPQKASPYYSNQSFVMQSRSSSQNNVEDAKKNVSGIISKGTLGKKTPQGNKLNSVATKRFLTGSVDQIVRWHKMGKKINLYVIYEVPAVLESISLSPSGEYILILRSDEGNCKPLQAVFYPIDRPLPQVNAGQLVMCVGRMVGDNKLQIYDLWPIQPDSLAGSKRISFLCQRSLQETYLAFQES